MNPQTQSAMSAATTKTPPPATPATTGTRLVKVETTIPHLVTKAEAAAAEKRAQEKLTHLHDKIAQVRVEISQLEVKMLEQFRQSDARMQEMKSDLQQQIHDLNAELQKRLHDYKLELQQQHHDFKTLLLEKIDESEARTKKSHDELKELFLQTQAQNMRWMLGIALGMLAILLPAMHMLK